MAKIKIGSLLLQNLKPWRLLKIYRLQKNRKKVQRVYDDAQLKLYARMLPQGFLHYGYFSDPSIKAEDISLNALETAQLQYAINIVEKIEDKESPVLDVGCGMGGLLKLLEEQKLYAVALTPDINQADYVGKHYSFPVIHARFEDMNTEAYPHFFGTVITSESLQYLNLAQSLPLIKKILKPGGKWVACDYFRIGEATEKSGHRWETFIKVLDDYGFELQFEQDITEHILPTIAYVYMWATRIALPLKDFILGKIEVKAPGIYYALQDSIPQLQSAIDKNINTIDPVIFRQHKQYKLLVITCKH